MFIELHILQNFAPSNLNRDDTGNPKDTEFGGVRRARISSQAVKRAIRLHPVFARVTEVEPAVRTRWMTRLLVEALVKGGKKEEEAKEVANAFAVQYSKLEEKKGHTSVLLYLSKTEVDLAVKSLTENWKEVTKNLKEGKSPEMDALAKELFKELKDRTSAPDIALFGRMLAEKPELNIDAACQVAHAISTHRVNMDMDFYTAVDDLTRDDEAGAGMMGVTAFNSACFYRYARIDWDLLVKNLGDRELARKTVEGFLRAAALAIPSGKQNSFAAQNPPDFMLGVVRKDGQSWSLANAFETPVKPGRDGGLMAASIEKLNAYWAKLNKVYGGNGMTSAELSLDGEENMEGWLGKLLGSLE
ncbi:MAG: type I-E CRISPR-associated protein Cas7/Cse4/CasC [Chloroflexi bacterium]|jgi:CRISPR system Cascade subunit CasC|nr:type I-E CRISPR-associated protein Cas7/Cse4/CasC [Chloroflexota bacterium]